MLVGRRPKLSPVFVLLPLVVVWTQAIFSNMLSSSTVWNIVERSCVWSDLVQQLNP